jgi:hypothetical protein
MHVKEAFLVSELIIINLMFIRQNGLTIAVIVISIAALSLIVTVLSVSSHVLAEIQQKMGNSRLNTLPTTNGHMYTVTLNNFFVNHTRSSSTDTDFVSMGSQSSCGHVNCVVGSTAPIRTATIFYRNVGCCGQHDIGLSLGPFFVTDGLRLDYSVLNYGHGSGSPYMTGDLNAVLTSVIHNGSAFNTKLLTTYLQNIGVAFGGCDGGVAADTIFYTPGQLYALTSATGQSTITRHYLGYASPFGCSSGVSDYFVTYTITRVS